MDVFKNNDYLYCFYNLTTVSLSLDSSSCCQKEDTLKLVWCYSFVPAQWQEVLSDSHSFLVPSMEWRLEFISSTLLSQTQLAALGEA